MLKKNLYKNQYGNIYYRKIIDGVPITLSAHTNDSVIANKLHSALEYQALSNFYDPVDKVKFMPFESLVKKYLDFDHVWTKGSRKMTSGALYTYLNNKGKLPENPNAQVIIRQRVNTCINWGIKNNIKTDVPKFQQVGTSIPRTRVFNKEEMDLLLNETNDLNFRSFIQFAYYTGARRGELVGLKNYHFKPLYFEVYGKSGKRMVRLNTQARAILMGQNINEWDYTGDYISKKFKKELRRFNIRDGRFHDLRRTFGYDLIVKHNVPIFKVSKLLGHKSVSTTEKHYAPLLVNQIEDFTL